MKNLSPNFVTFSSSLFHLHIRVDYSPQACIIYISGCILLLQRVLFTNQGVYFQYLPAYFSSQLYYSHFSLHTLPLKWYYSHILLNTLSLKVYYFLFKFN